MFLARVRVVLDVIEEHFYRRINITDLSSAFLFTDVSVVPWNRDLFNTARVDL